MNPIRLGGEPTNDKEQAEARPTTDYSVTADKARKAKMSPAELAWEVVLEENLGDFYLPRYKKDKEDGKITAWDFVKDDPTLPRLLIIGDSISRAYTVTVREELRGKANVHRAPENCGPTKTALQKLDVWLGKGEWDVITFNFGIHDRGTPNQTYAKNLETIVARLKTTKAMLIWVNSTPLSEGTFGFNRGMMPPKNEIAAPVMKKHGIPIIDLYEAALPLTSKWQLQDGCHFEEEGNQALGTVVSKEVKTLLKENNQ